MDKQTSTDLERWEHLALLLAVSEVVQVLHGDERRQVVGNRVVYPPMVTELAFM